MTHSGDLEIALNGALSFVTMDAVARDAIAEVKRLEGLLDEISTADVWDHWDYGVWIMEHLPNMEWGPPDPST